MKKTFFIVIVLLTIVHFASGPILKSVLNRAGADDKGYSYHIENLKFSPFTGRVKFEDVDVYQPKTKFSFIKISEMIVHFNWISLIRAQKKLAIKIPKIDFIISSALSEEMKRVKEDAKKLQRRELHLDDVTIEVGEFNLKNMQDDSIKKLITFHELTMDLKNLGLHSINKNTKFSLDTQIKGGGSMDLAGKTKLQQDNTPWTITGSMQNITAPVIEKLSGGNLPFKIKEAHFNADITAHSQDGKIQGEIKPLIKNIELDKDQESTTKKLLSKATNFLFNKKKNDKGELEFTLPFTLKNDFSIDLKETVNQLKDG